MALSLPLERFTSGEGRFSSEMEIGLTTIRKSMPIQLARQGEERGEHDWN